MVKKRPLKKKTIKKKIPRVDRLPRHMLRLNIADLRTGESGWVSHYQIRVDALGRVAVDTKAEILIRAGRQEEGGNTYGDHLITKTETGYMMTVFRNTTFNTGPYTDFETWMKETSGAMVVEKLVYPADIEPCSCCGGAGFIKSKEPVSDKKRKRKFKRRSK